jgi:FkbM family methyltransferase
MRIGFTAIHLSERGTTTALYDYAYFNEELLHNTSIILYQKNHPLNFPDNETMFRRNFATCRTFDSISDIDNIVEEEKLDALYIIKYGVKDEVLTLRCPNLVHGVFVSEPHGQRYALISHWLSKKYGGNIPYVPHMINLPSTEDNLRKELNIPNDAIVFGGYGGKNSFNIQFVHKCIDCIVQENPHIYFLFMNFDRSCAQHPQIIYLKGSIDRWYKTKFINTCDAMIHARDVGETFGLAVGEFSTRNKPVITHLTPSPHYDKEHIRNLGERGIYYVDAESLLHIFRNFSKEDVIRVSKSPQGWNCYRDYEPVKVMEIFEKVFLNIVTCDFGGKKWLLYQNDNLSRCLIEKRGWEPHITKTFQRLVKKGDVAIDIGANFGYHTLTLSDLVGPSGTVFAFEPQRFIYSLLRRNIYQNIKEKNVYAVRAALSDTNGYVTLTNINWIEDNINMGDTYIRSSIVDDPTNKVVCRRFDDYYFPTFENKPINIIKIDIQGCELKCLRGMRRILTEFKPYIVIEVEEICLRRFDATSSEIFDELRNYGYTIFYIQYEYPSDHLCVHNSRLDEFMSIYKPYISPHTQNNDLNANVANGVSLKIAFP